MFTMGDVARCSVGKPGEFHNEDLLYKLFGVNAELLIDHAWGYEPCTIADIRAYRPESNSVGSGQVLHCAYTAEKGKLITREMTDLLVLDLVDKGFTTNQMVLTVGYDIENLTDLERLKKYRGEVTTDHYGRKIPKHAHGTANLPRRTSSTKIIMDAVTELYDRILDPDLLVRRINIVACNILPEQYTRQEETFQQMDMFSDFEEQQRKKEEEDAYLARERKRQQAMLTIQKKYGKNAILKGMNFEEGAMTRARNGQIGGHKA